MSALDPRRCACATGAPCDGPTRSYRRQDKHGAALVVDQPSHWESTDPDPRAPRGAYTGPVTWRDCVDARGNATWRAEATRADTTPLTQGRPNGPDPLDPRQRRVTDLPFATFLTRRTASVLSARDAARHRFDRAGQTPVGPAHVTRRSRRATLNTTVKHGADRAMDIADHFRSRDRAAATPPLTGRARRAAKRAAHAARLAEKRGPSDER